MGRNWATSAGQPLAGEPSIVAADAKFRPSWGRDLYRGLLGEEKIVAERQAFDGKADQTRPSG
jgi:hypothetical protein